MTTNTVNEEANYQIGEKFPYRFLLRWTWPEHVERSLRRLMWAWLQEQSENANDELSSSDYVATHLFWLIAVSPETPGAVLDALSSTGSTAFLERIAENPNTWASTLKKLAENPSDCIRIAVADNANTPAETLLQLSLDESDDIRFAVAGNCHQAVTILESLVHDENCHVAARSKRTLAQMNPVQPTQIKPKTNSATRKKAVGQ